MTATANPLDQARFWVRPYEFEGDGSHGAANSIASLEVTGKTRTFWLKTLENRLFFREVGRDESWNFSAIEELRESEKSDLPTALANVLASENYGRVVLPDGLWRAHHLLVAPDDRLWTLVGGVEVSPESRWKSQKSARARHFLDWPPGVFSSITRYRFHPAGLPDFLAELNRSPVPSIAPCWLLGSQQEWERVIKSLFICCGLGASEPVEKSSIVWDLSSAYSQHGMIFGFLWQMSDMLEISPSFNLYSRPIEQRARFIINQFSFIGQTHYNGENCRAFKIEGVINAPTNHEILEAQLYLRDWINQRLPPEQARRWLDFS